MRALEIEPCSSIPHSTFRMPHWRGAGGGGVLRVGVDVGGTFTDLVALAQDGTIEVRKVVTTPDDPAVGLFRALDPLKTPPPPLQLPGPGTPIPTHALPQPPRPRAAPGTPPRRPGRPKSAGRYLPRPTPPPPCLPRGPPEGPPPTLSSCSFTVLRLRPMPCSSAAVPASHS